MNSQLIINEIALDAARADNDRQIVRQKLGDCESSQITDNTVAINNIIYFTEDIAGSPYDRLSKRTITPSYDLCSRKI